MRVMVIVKASKESEAGALPSAKLLTKMGQYNEELAKAGLLLAADGLRPSSQGKRVKFSGTGHFITDGPFAETSFWRRKCEPEVLAETHRDVGLNPSCI